MRDDGTVFVSEHRKHRVLAVTLGGAVAVAGTGQGGFAGDGGPAVQAQLNGPDQLALDPLQRYLYVVDKNNHRIRGIDLTSGLIYTIAGSGDPVASGDGGPAAQAGMAPSGIAVAPDGRLYVSETAGSGGLQIGEAVYGVRHPRTQQQLPGNIRVILADGTIHTVTGRSSYAVVPDGSNVAGARFLDPRGMTVDRQGNLYVADAGWQRVFRIEAGPDGAVPIAAQSAVPLSP